jgi:hypothetical protein
MSESKNELPDSVPSREKRIIPTPTKRMRRGRVYYEERRKRVAELRAIGNLTFEQIGERITAYGFASMSKERAWPSLSVRWSISTGLNVGWRL